MKFPHELSKERLSLLSEEDRKIYDMEHSGLYSLEPKVVPNVGVIDEDAKIIRQMDLFLFESLFDELFDKELIEVVGEEEYMNIKKNLFEFIENDPEMQGELFEAPGHAADWWLPNGLKIGWLGKLAAGLLTGLLGIAAWLFMKGKDRLAMKKLKQYMNKLVELIDMGVNKKRPWYSFLMVSKKNRLNTGEYNKACFRTIQETAERNMACLYTLCIHNLGFLNPGITDFRGITSGMMPEEGSGLDNFKNAIAGNVNDLNTLDNLKTEANDSYIKLLPILPDLSKFYSLKLPALPTNYTMLMCNIEYPAKADKNPNGSLFMKPTQEILQAKAEDIGLVYFNENLDVNNIIHWEETEALKAENAAYNYALMNPYIQMLLEADEDEQLDQQLNNQQEKNTDNNQEENKTDLNTNAGRRSKFDAHGGLITGDIDNEIIGGELETHTEGKRTTRVQKFEGNIIEALDGYIRMSIPVVLKLIKAICGQLGFKNSNSFEGMMGLLLSAGEGSMLDWLKEEDEVLNKLSKKGYQDDINRQLDINKAIKRINLLLSWYLPQSKYTEFKNYIDNTLDKGEEFFQLLLKLMENLDNYRNPVQTIDEELEEILGKGNKFNTLKAKFIEKEEKEKEEKHESIDVYLTTDLYYKPIYEDVIQQEDEEIFENLSKTLDVTYNKVRNYLGELMGSTINSDSSTWYIITSSRDRMNKLKEAADKEINAKIELICRLAGEGKTDIGDKFKSAISKHPMRAESLKRIWAMYSDDLSDRMETRIRSITGDNGNSNILTSIKLFLVNVYPNLMAAMLYYREFFFLIETYTKRYPLSSEYRQKLLELKEIEKAKNEFNAGRLMSLTPDEDSSAEDSTPADSTEPSNASTAEDNITRNLPQ